MFAERQKYIRQCFPGALVTAGCLGGHFKTGNFVATAETGEFYFVPSSVRKSLWTFVPPFNLWRGLPNTQQSVSINEAA